MVWFQCEDCGEDLKKPKLANHFRICSANKLSCIDCGQTFGQQSVQSHTQCITEAEKYGPKGQVKVSNGATPKSQNGSKQKPEVDINVGLTERAPWFCSLCNTKATSRQTLLLHADGKKHRAKARAFHAANQPPKQPEELTPNSDVPIETKPKEPISENGVKEPEKQDLSKSSDSENGKKRKHDATEIDCEREKTFADATGELGSGEVIQPETEAIEVGESKAKKAKLNAVLESNASKDTRKKIKWKKLITSALNSNPDGALKIRKLRKLVLKDLRESGRTDAEAQLCDTLEQKIKSSSKFIVDNKYVRIAS